MPQGNVVKCRCFQTRRSLERLRAGVAFPFLAGRGRKLEQKGIVDMKKKVLVVFGALCLSVLAALAAQTVQHFYCKYCGYKSSSVRSLTASLCQRHPNGPGAGRHALYEGGEKSSYTCKYCGLKSSAINSLTSSKCQRHPNGPMKGRHEPAL